MPEGAGRHHFPLRHLGVTVAKVARGRHDDDDSLNSAPRDYLPGRFQTCDDNGVAVWHVAPYWIRVELCLPVEKYKGQKLSTAIAAAVKTKHPSREWWRQALEAGRLEMATGHARDAKKQASKKVADTNTVITKRTSLSGYYHFHEDAMMLVAASGGPTIVLESKEYVIVNKPAGMDVLSNPDAGRVFQSMPGWLLLSSIHSGITTTTTTTTTIYPAHRIDNAVSGLVCCGKTPTDCKRLSRRIELGQAQKTYVARVCLTTPELWQRLQTDNNLPWTISAPLGWDAVYSKAVVDKTSGKPSETVIVDRWTDTYVPNKNDSDDEPPTVVIVVQPRSGRKHQLRCHLQLVGLPIVNDVKYGFTTTTPATAHKGSDVPSTMLYDSNHKPLRDFFQPQQSIDSCKYCQYVQACFRGERPSPRLCTTSICLHSWKYEFAPLGLSFEAPLPDWARTHYPGARQCCTRVAK